MNSKWETHRGDEYWYSDNTCEAEGWFSVAYPIHLEIWLKNLSDRFTEETLYNFLSSTQKDFPESQLWLILNPRLKKMMTSLKEMKKLDWTIIKNPLSESDRITYISCA